MVKKILNQRSVVERKDNELVAIDFIDKFKVLKYKMKLNCESDKYYTISGNAKSKSVKWNVLYRFSKQRGFELMQFEYGEKTKIQLELIDIIEH